ncbi:NAD(P)/FAD-dependent oxidoreductase [Rhodococcus sp. HNM0569]|uniref:NAD(P)/FAD-dependent oxidoreductase n=1 Tax=Rhodococcus sp. HNM0569 TaxID=2716340 RepID=UPI00146B2403|nr:NAD(P)/FAD-dependent oxidoreductase [Rhodococcus sp. HNM0569]NLU82000.1 NAD(P)/FAD-dependent oxidoreductase [Rhodococcus sp. HNM0569]
MTDNERIDPSVDRVDVAVLGGGAAGLSAALVLGEALRSVVVIDNGAPRNAPATHIHGYLTRDATSPAEFLDAGRAQARAVGARFLDAAVDSVEQVGESADCGPAFDVRLRDGAMVRARRVLVATGLVDAFDSEIAGVAEQWGRGVAHCPYCHGYEVRGSAIAVLSTDTARGVHQALLLRQWSEDVTLFIHSGDDPDEVSAERLAARGVDVVAGPVERLEQAGDAVTGVVLASGERYPAESVFVGAMLRAEPNDAVLTALGAETRGTPFGPFVKVDSMTFATSVPGVYAAGNVVDPSAQVIVSAAAGYRAAAMLNFDLVEEDTDAAVEEARRSSGTRRAEKAG